MGYVQTVEGPDGGIRVYANDREREEAVIDLLRQGFNYFTRYQDAEGHGLSYGRIDWAPLYGALGPLREGLGGEHQEAYYEARAAGRQLPNRLRVYFTRSTAAHRRDGEHVLRFFVIASTPAGATNAVQARARELGIQGRVTALELRDRGDAREFIHRHPRKVIEAFSTEQIAEWYKRQVAMRDGAARVAEEAAL